MHAVHTADAPAPVAAAPAAMPMPATPAPAPASAPREYSEPLAATAIAAPPPTPTVTMPARTRSRRPRRRTLVIGVLVVALGVGGGIAYEVLKPAPTTPASVVQQYFDDLGKGDTAAALTLVSDASQLSSQASTTLLVPQALSSASTRPTDVQVGTTNTLTGFPGVSAAGYSVRVTYKLGGTSMTANFPVLKAPSGAKSPYLLEAPFFDLEVGDPGGRAVTVNGITVDVSQASTYLAFPGAYTATAQGNALLASDTATGTVTSGAAFAGTDTINFAPPQLASGAQDAIQAQIKQQIDTCAQSTDPYPSGCPFDLYSVYIDGSVSSVQWSITNYPTVTVTPAAQISPAEQADFSDSAHDGVAHYDVTYTDYFGATQTTSGDVSFGVNGTAAVSGSGITLGFSSFN